MSLDNLNAPLGYTPPPGAGLPTAAAARKLAPADDGPLDGAPWGKIAVGGLGLVASLLVGFLYATDDGLGGEPFARARIETRIRLPAPASGPSGAGAPMAGVSVDDVTGSTLNLRRTTSQVEEASGVKITRQGGGAAPGAMIISVPQENAEVGLTPAPDRRLVDKSRHGAIPRVGPDGARAMDVYARPVITPASVKPGAPRIALFIGGMGLNPEATQAAVAALPRAVTLGFAPYGPDLARQTASAREEGHEIVLQAPMEGFSEAEDPGPNVLRVRDPAPDTLGRLHWHMSRFPGYVGVAGFLGGKFTSERAAFAPVLSEIGVRGLFYMDDGASSRSLAATLAAETATPLARADVVIDARLDAIDEALVRLERLARERGAATGAASGLPLVVEKVARFARALEGRGVALVPLSSLAQTLKPSSARAAP
ncbi:MAG: hypothetical protein JWN93_1864 [Hyphomicrobiales bacterium]|nr:hypothetical protein [Hyphomicrobiales bacterium]